MKLEEILPEIRRGRRFSYVQEYSPICTKSRFFDATDLNLNIPLFWLSGDGWELEPIKKEISRDDLAEAWDRALIYNRGFVNSTPTLSTLCKELGL